ncbi:hypothetical protein JOC86_000721 [Bacillus pakistanensis]|uniref:Uncharacterized protein n=1 Tax=Rossellomorea pakistanensis TaxID=992288 RepID=A0ABS2N8P0_9BACI|nr:hypothetical protein [Bacillus pakistanensis]MBM7584184.1 hypothetical protein [Bacillus pakistanensis]
MQESYKFRFQVKDVIQLKDELQSMTVTVHTIILSEANKTIFQDTIRVKFNQIGIFPSPSDIARKIKSNHLRRLIAVELKRYIKPQRRFLEPGDY